VSKWAKIFERGDDQVVVMTAMDDHDQNPVIELVFQVSVGSQRSVIGFVSEKDRDETFEQISEAKVWNTVARARKQTEELFGAGGGK
jgi:hypothetical protein